MATGHLNGDVRHWVVGLWDIVADLLLLGHLNGPKGLSLIYILVRIYTYQVE